MVARSDKKLSKSKATAAPVKTQDADGKKKAARIHKFKPTENFERHLYRLLKQIHPELGVGRTTMVTLNHMLLEVYKKLARTAGEVSAHTKGQTLTAKDIQTAIKLSLPGEFQKHAVSESAKAVL